MTASVHALNVMAEQVTGRGLNGVVTAAAPLAAQAGAAILREGGNAFDAAVAAALAETVLLPPKCGLGGDIVALVVEAAASHPQAMIAVGGAGARHGEVARSGRWSDVGPDSVGPPAAGAGYAALAERGRLDRERLAESAIALALGGFPWAQVCTQLSQQAATLVAEMNPSGTTYYPGGEPIPPGAVARLPGLADALSEWVERGGRFLEGPVGEAIVGAIADRGGALGADDLAAVAPAWEPCARVEAGGRTIWATPAPTHGPGLLAAMADYVSGQRTPADLHGAVMAAIARQRRELSDPSGTSMVSAADSDGTVVVIVHSNSYPRFGSGIVVPGYDLILANRAGRGFTPEVGHPNFPEAGRRPATTVHAWALSDESGACRWVGGTPGGANQLPWNAQTLARILAGEERPGHLVASPLWEWLPDDDGLRIEGGFAPDDADAIAERATRRVDAPRWGCKSAHQVVRIPSPGTPWEAAADPRTVGMALGV